MSQCLEYSTFLKYGQSYSTPPCISIWTWKNQNKQFHVPYKDQPFSKVFNSVYWSLCRLLSTKTLLEGYTFEEPDLVKRCVLFFFSAGYWPVCNITELFPYCTGLFCFRWRASLYCNVWWFVSWAKYSDQGDCT